MEDAKYIELAAKYLSGDISSTERRKLMEWVAESDANQAFFDEMIHLWGMAADAERLFEADITFAWNKVANRIQVNPGPKKEDEAGEVRLRGKIFPLSINKSILRIAAVVLPLLMVGAWWLLQPKSTNERLIVSEDVTREVLLPDGSQVWLNKNSQLSYLEDFQERKVTLVGEAFFEITRDTLHPFEIYSDQTITRVLGTSFNIRAYPEDKQIVLTVTTGRVAFQEKDDHKDALTLMQGEAAIFLKAEKKIQPVASLGTNAVAWKNEVLGAPDIPLSQFLQTLDNYFGKQFIVENPDILSCNITIPELERPELDSVLYILEEVMNLQVDSSGNYIRLLGGTGCK